MHDHKRSAGDVSPGRADCYGAVHVTEHGMLLKLYLAPLRAGISALLLALFGAACLVIGSMAAVGLLHSSASITASLLAFAFAGVFALPLAVMGLCFIVLALWTAANSLSAEISTDGIRVQHRWLGCSLSCRTLPRDEITSIDAAPAAGFLGIFGGGRSWRLIARGRKRALLIADSLIDVDAAENLRARIIERLNTPGAATAKRGCSEPLSARWSKN